MLTMAALLALIVAPTSAAAPSGIAASMAPSASSARVMDMPIAAMAPRPRNRGASIRIPDPAPAPPLPPIQGPSDASRPLIIIDPGHGGHDPGARNGHNGWQEKDLTLAIGRSVRDALLRSGRVRVALTRDDDRFLALEERYTIGREMGAALFISIHADASEEGGARGATVYTLSEVASDKEADRLATRENRADVLNGVDLSGKSSAVSSILIDLMQRRTMGASVRFAELLHREAAPLITFRTPYHRRASLVVLRSPDTPSVLFETGYISNDSEAAWLGTPEGRAKVAQGIARAVAVYVATNAAPQSEGTAP
jgi:N-acetylmuramoyl-L-alanine amidase